MMALRAALKLRTRSPRPCRVAAKREFRVARAGHSFDVSTLALDGARRGQGFRRFNVSTFRRFDVSTVRLFDVSAFRRFDVSRPAVTLIELTASMGLLLLAIITVAAIFNISSEAAGRTAAHVQVLEASAAVHGEIADKLTRIAPGFLLIESPPPTMARAETPEGPRYYRLRHDRLVFLATHGGEGAFESFTDPTRGTPAFPARGPAASPDALVYFGPGIPVQGDGSVSGTQRDFAEESIGLTASEWVFMHRSILLLSSFVPADHPDWNAPGGPQNVNQVFRTANGMLDGGTLRSNFLNFFEGRMDAVISDTSASAFDASAASLIAVLAGHAPLLSGTFLVPASFQGELAATGALWEPGLVPVSASYADPQHADYFTRSGWTFMPRLADFRIEWTDGGRVDPLGEDFRTRWFGLAPAPLSVDGANVPDLGSPNALRYQARLRGLTGGQNPSNPNPQNPDNGDPNPNNPNNESDATFAFRERIEGPWMDQFQTSSTSARYRAVWRGTDYERYRPKALRFTYRIYDANNRLRQPTTLDLNEDGVADPGRPGSPSSDPYIVTRWGKEFSVVVPLP